MSKCCSDLAVVLGLAHGMINVMFMCEFAPYLLGICPMNAKRKTYMMNSHSSVRLIMPE